MREAYEPDLGRRICYRWDCECRAGGEPATPETASPTAEIHPGTINVILVTNARLSAAAMVGMVQVATEAKTAVLLRAKVKSWTGRSGATGTGTDAVVVVSWEWTSYALQWNPHDPRRTCRASD